MARSATVPGEGLKSTIDVEIESSIVKVAPMPTVVPETDPDGERYSKSSESREVGIITNI
jgi:hypothetical protein